jgi:hypothetical protein
MLRRSLSTRSGRIRLALLAVAACMLVWAAVAVAAQRSQPAPPRLLVGGGILAAPHDPNGYLVNMTIAPSTGQLTGRVWVTACNRRACHTALGGGSVPIVNVPFSLGHPAAGAHVAVSVAVCSPGFTCVRAEMSGSVPRS